ncbi:cytochrome P450 [Jimgerdemannia flammicorona]|uniref:Cytochrome P450 n=1 Tax=Jimgerdemannia flammicorona TaxID=994334 RepID=A0A433QXD7_9FUNG|nr:cytochrome P450 [Jimgerdemannia flammicorona]
MSSITPSHIVDTLTDVSSALLASLRRVPSSAALSSVGVLAAAYVILFQYFEINQPAGWRKVPSVTGKAIWNLFFKKTLEEQYQGFFKPTHEEHGILRSSLIRFNRVEVSTPEFARQILSQPGTLVPSLIFTHAFPKLIIADRDPTSLTALFFGTNLVFSNGDVWKRHRRIANPAFHRAWNTQVFGDLSLDMFEELDKLVEKGKTADVHDFVQRLTLDALGKTVFDFNFGAIKNPESDYVKTYNEIMKGRVCCTINSLQRSTFSGSTSSLYIIFPWLDKFPLTRRYNSFKNVKHFNALIDNLIDKRRKELDTNGIADEDYTDLLSLMIKASDDEKNPSARKSMNDVEMRVSIIINNMVIFFLAGHDTTANALACVIYYLAVHQVNHLALCFIFFISFIQGLRFHIFTSQSQDVQRKAHAEVLTLLSADSTALVTPTFDETKHLPYLTNIIKETLRLCPSVAQLPMRIASRDVAMGPYIIPQNTFITINFFALHHSRKVWGDDAEEFRPERFEGHQVDEKLADPDADPAVGEGKRDTYSWLPFSFGSRSFQKYEWSLPANSPHKDNILFRPGNLLRPKNLQIQFKKRM